MQNYLYKPNSGSDLSLSLWRFSLLQSFARNWHQLPVNDQPPLWPQPRLRLKHAGPESAAAATPLHHRVSRRRRRAPELLVAAAQVELLWLPFVFSRADLALTLGACCDASLSARCAGLVLWLWPASFPSSQSQSVQGQFAAEGGLFLFGLNLRIILVWNLKKKIKNCKGRILKWNYQHLFKNFLNFLAPKGSKNTADEQLHSDTFGCHWAEHQWLLQTCSVASCSGWAAVTPDNEIISRICLGGKKVD